MKNNLIENKKYTLKNGNSFILNKDKYCCIMNDEGNQMAAFSVYKDQISQIICHFDNPGTVLEVIQILLQNGYSLDCYELSGLNFLPLSSELFCYLAINVSNLDVIKINGNICLNLASEFNYKPLANQNYSLVKSNDLSYERMLYSLSIKIFNCRYYSAFYSIIDFYVKDYMTEKELDKYKNDPSNYAHIFGIWSRQFNKNDFFESSVNIYSFHEV